MRLGPLLAGLGEEDLGRLVVEHLRNAERQPRAEVCGALESALRNHGFVRDLVLNRQPPAFALLTTLLDAPGYELPIEELRAKANQDTTRIAEMITGRDWAERAPKVLLYRRALEQARRSDLNINSSESAILAVLRRELQISQVEHFLIEHHADLQVFWNREGALVHEENALRTAGIVFFRGERAIIAEDVAPAVWQTLGIDMPTQSVRRLLACLSNSELLETLSAAGSRTAGSKDVRLERIVIERIQPSEFLRSSVGLSTLKDICRQAGAGVTGNKDELVERIIAQFARGKDQKFEEPVEPVTPERRKLSEHGFATLFGFLHHQELTDILRRFPDLRQTGAKEIKIVTLWQGHLSEESYLSELRNRDLEDILGRLRLRLGGSKYERISRIVSHFDTSVSHPTGEDSVGVVIASSGAESPAPEQHAARALFRQKAANQQTSLQPWLEEVLEAPGAVRCYATEDSNPTKQLKNKLAQAAAARGGVLFLTLVDEDAYAKVLEALVERWVGNDEWSKSVACVALAFPLAAPAVHAIVECSHSPWAERIRDRLFASSAILRARNSLAQMEGIQSRSCTVCEQHLPDGARFCPNCGAKT